MIRVWTICHREGITATKITVVATIIKTMDSENMETSKGSGRNHLGKMNPFKIECICNFIKASNYNTFLGIHNIAGRR